MNPSNDQAGLAAGSLRFSYAQLAVLYNPAPAPFWLHFENRIVYINPAGWKALGGASAAEVCGRSPLDFIHPDWHATVNERIRDTLAARGPRPTIEEVFVRVDGAPITVEVTSWLIPYELGPAIAVTFVDITEKKRVVHDAAERAEAQRLALSIAQLGTWSRDVATGALTFSERAAEIYGLSPPYPATWEDLREMLEFPGSDEFPVVARKALASGTDFDFEFQVRRTDGEWRWVAVRGSWLRWPDGSPREVRGVMQDVSERKRYEQRIVQLNRELETRVLDFETLFAAMPAALAVSRENINDIRVNPTMSRLLGVPVTVNASKTAPEGADLPFRFLRRDGTEIPGDQLPQQVAFREARPVENVELEVLRADGEKFHLFGSASPLFGEAGKVRGTIGAFVDVTRRRVAEDGLRVSEERYRSLVQASVSIVWTADARGRATTQQPQFSDYTGLSWDEYKEYGWLDAVHPGDREGLRRILKARNSRVQPYEFECRLRHAPSGAWNYCLTRAVPVFEPGGAIREWVGTITDIDEQKRTQLALRFSEERFRRVIEGSIFGIVIKAFDGPIIYANSAFLKIIGYTSDDLTQGGLNWHELTPPEWLAPENEHLRELRENGAPRPFEKEYIRRDGSRVPVRIAGTLVREPFGDRGVWVAFVEDLTERRRAESALRESKERLDLAAEAGSIGIFDWNFVTGEIVWSEKLEDLYGIPRGSFRGNQEHWQQLIYPPDLAAILDGIAATRARGERDLAGEFRVARDGRLRWITARGRLLYDDAGALLRMIGVNIDITERKESEQALRLAGERLQFHLENTPLAAIEFDPNYRVTRWSDRAREMFGWTADEVCGDSIVNLRWIHEDDLDSVKRICGEMSTGNIGPNVHASRNYRKDGSIIHCEWYNSTLRADDGSLQSVFSLVLDVTAREKAQAEIARLNAEIARRLHELETIIELAPVGLAIASDPQCRVIRHNNYMHSVLGLPQGMNGSKTGPEADRLPYRVLERGEDVPLADLPMQLAARKAVEVRDRILRIERQDGAGIDLLCYAAPLRDEDGKVWGSVGAFLDVTERLRTEHELRRSNADLSQFAYAVSHDLREPLRMMTSFSQLLKQRYSMQLDSQAGQSLDYVVEGANRMEALLGDLLVYSRLTHEETGLPARSDSSQILEKVLFNLASAIGECGAVVKVRSDLPVLAVHEVHLVQLLQNLLANAIKYRKPGEKPQISVGASRDGSRWVFSIQDNGIGIQPQYRERIFGIFKRLHGREYPGTGIGLALCRRIVESYGGAIWVESEPDRGSTFFFALPVAE